MTGFEIRDSQMTCWNGLEVWVIFILSKRHRAYKVQPGPKTWSGVTFKASCLRAARR
jgi:hypothetical protein